MGRRRGQLAQRLAHHRRIALHHQAGDALIARPGGVGDDGPAILVSDPRRLDDGIVVGACDANHLGAEAGDRGDALVADAGMDEDHRPARRRAARPARPSGRDCRRWRRRRSCLRRPRERPASASSATSTARPKPLRRCFEHEPDHRIGAAQRLEAAEARAVGPRP